MKLLSLEDCFELFFETPSAATFASVRERVLEDDGYQPDWEKLHEVTRLVQQRRRRQAIEAVDALMPAWGLCPRLHYLAGLAAEQAGDWEEVELRRFLMQACLDGLLASGSGTAARPFWATYPSDVRDVAAARGEVVMRQRLVERHGRTLDQATLASGKSLWFDVGDLLAAGGRIAELPAAATISRLR